MMAKSPTGPNPGFRMLVAALAVVKAHLTAPSLLVAITLSACAGMIGHREDRPVTVLRLR